MDFRQFDEAYLERLCRGDSDVEEHFTAYFGQLILIKLRHRLKSRDAIDDIRQETFLRVFRILRSTGVRHPEKLGALVNSICNNVFLEACRSRRYEELSEDVNCPAAAADAVDGLVSEERRREVQRILDELPDRDRRLLRAVFLDEASRDAVCAEFRVDRDYLRVLLHRAKESFRARFRGGESSDQPRPPARPQLRSS